ncbi:type II 3-dehydroquinate dehydratase [Brevibacillus centrosporus]|uniref:3-dehydroquinate dehydratase n=1 Tax=Brevibacillus centrosporus TaxID=54910 RepID=A0A1I4E4R0_9BACL|nr:type II 3-dehydroquinate dehydratase [Brevibacillus centrosporus]SFK99940.1 3-dehydroquinate dehydratase [Brevibacillus centrosporus]
MVSSDLLLLNGPNLNLLGIREPHIYGNTSLKELEEELIQFAESRGCALHTFQSNHEGDLVERIHRSKDVKGIILNPGAFMSYSYSLRDAISSVSTPVVEVHISNIYSRESWRHKSVISDVVIGQISGFGKYSYMLGIEAIIYHTHSGAV